MKNATENIANKTIGIHYQIATAQNQKTMTSPRNRRDPKQRATQTNQRNQQVSSEAKARKFEDFRSRTGPQASIFHEIFDFRNFRVT